MKIVGCVVLLLLVTLPASGQEVRGNISGTVKDAGGVLPGASVEITNVDTGISQHLVTNATGYFEAPLLQPGNYQVTVQLEGYRKVVRPGIVLGVSQQVSLPFQLEVGGIAETITVSAESPLLDTSAVSSSQTFDAKMVETLPMISNMPIMLTRFAAGVNPTPTQTLVSQGFADGTTTAAGEVVGGVGSNTYSIDGATNSGTGRRLAASPNADMIEEMRVESSNFDASVGHGLGLQISMLTRAGASQYRGTGNYQVLDQPIECAQPQSTRHVHGHGQGFVRLRPIAQCGVDARRAAPHSAPRSGREDVLLPELLVRERLHPREEPGREHGSSQCETSCR